MTGRSAKRLEALVEALRRLSSPAQDGLAQAIQLLQQGKLRNEIGEEHLPFVLEGLAQLVLGEFATDAEVAEAFRAFEA